MLTFTRYFCIFFSHFEGTRGDKNQIFRTLEFTNYVKGINLPINYTDELLLDTNKTKLMVPGWGKEMHLGKSLTLNINHSQLLPVLYTVAL